QDTTHRGQPEEVRRCIDNDRAQAAPRRLHSLAHLSPEGWDVNQQEQEQAEDADGDPRAGRLQVQVNPDEVDDLLNEDQRGEGAAKRQDQVESEPAADHRPEEQRRQPLQPAQVDLAAVVDAVQLYRKLAVETDQLIAQQHGVGPADIGQLELIAGDRVAQVAHRQEAALGDTIEHVLDDLLARDLLGVIRGAEADVLEGIGQARPQLLAEPLLAVVDRGAQQDAETAAVLVADVCLAQPFGGVAQVLDEQHVGLQRHGPLDRLGAERDDPLDEVNGVEVALVIDADFLQIVEQTGRRRPDAACSGAEQGRQGGAPLLGLAVVQLQRGL